MTNDLHFTPPRSTYREWRLSSRYAPALCSRDYKDPKLVIEIIETNDEAIHDTRLAATARIETTH